MRRLLITTTALTLITASSAVAAGASDTTMSTAPAGEQMYVQNLGESHLASNLIGQIVYTSEAADAENVGEINDLIVADDGSVDAVVIGVGGFLGVGEKDVAVSYDQIRWAEDDSGSQFVVFAATAEDLQNAPAFVREEPDTAMAPADESMTGTDASTDTAMAPAEEPAEGTDTAMAPAEEPAEGTDTAMAPAEQSGDMVAAPSPRPQLSDVDAGSVSGEQLIGATVYARDDENVGEVGDVRLAADSGEVDAVIVDVGGFLGLGEKPVAIAFDSLRFKQDEGGSFYVYTDFTREELDSAQTYDEAAYDSERETMRLTMLRQ